MSKPILLTLSLAFVLAGCRKSVPTATPAVPPRPPTIKVSSSGFPKDGAIPKQFTCDGENFSPALSWDAAPAGTQTWALIVEDPDAPGGIFTHWVVANVPASTLQLAEQQTHLPVLATGATQGLNDFGQVGYGGPCPPQGTHHYRFRLFAVDSTLELPPAFDRLRLLAALKGHTLGEGTLSGTYRR